MLEIKLKYDIVIKILDFVKDVLVDVLIGVVGLNGKNSFDYMKKYYECEENIKIMFGDYKKVV